MTPEAFPEHDHQEVEMLLESYHKVCDEIVQASGNLVTNIRKRVAVGVENSLDTKLC
jgi:hypothetical protein